MFVIMADVRTAALHSYPVTVSVALLSAKLHMCSSCGSWRNVFKPKRKGRFLWALILLLYTIQICYSAAEYCTPFKYVIQQLNIVPFSVSILHFRAPNYLALLLLTPGARGGAVGRGTELQAGRSRVWFPMVSLDFFIDVILPAALWLWSRLSL